MIHKWEWPNRGCVCVWDKVAPDWRGREEWTSKRVRCPTLEEKQRFVTFALKSVNHSTIHRTRTN